MGWQYSLILAGLLFLAAIGLALWGAKLRNPVIPYQRINHCKPGAFAMKDWKNG